MAAVNQPYSPVWETGRCQFRTTSTSTTWPGIPFSNPITLGGSTRANFREIPASEKTALEAVMEADEERIKLEALAEMLALETDDASQEYLMQVGRSLLER